MERSKASNLWAVVNAVFALQALAIRPVQSSSSSGTKVAAFALGSFWRGEAVFGCLPGVVRTRAGYAGGTKQNPDYHNVGDHAEAVEVEYDPSVIAFDSLLDVFWASHDPTQVFGQGPDVGPQYRSVIFTQNDDDALVAITSKNTEQTKLGSDSEVVTEVQSLGVFYPAEAEHQKFELRRKSQLLQLLGEISDEELTSSVLATKLNGYAADLCPLNTKRLLDTKVDLELPELNAMYMDLTRLGFSEYHRNSSGFAFVGLSPRRNVEIVLTMDGLVLFYDYCYSSKTCVL